ncbi:MAG: endonuclease/exonuclease/phosphatase family protein [Puniceicoccales bacterium]|jgi:endonuclease/exonuclease/phosphatase family metal-dependent hydrolase|nr:endonuclease/exonuclease/phosphatase family protein [Puniceicoccales bacterium]
MPSYSQLAKKEDAAERARIVQNVLRLRAQLDAEIPPKTAGSTLLLATWNLREFGDNRLEESLLYIAEIIARFDLVAVQEVQANLGGLEKVAKLLGHGWDYLVTDSTDGTVGGSERIAFLYDKHKVFFRHITGEIVLPKEKEIAADGADPAAGTVQFARTPFCVSFQAGWFKFLLASVHIYYGKDVKNDPRRVAEITRIAEVLSARAKKEGESYILLGDFNIYGTGDKTMEGLEAGGFHVPDAIKAHPTDLSKQTKHYDQIAFNLQLDKTMTVFAEDGTARSGAFNFSKSVYPADNAAEYVQFFKPEHQAKTGDALQKYYNTWRTYEMSDHLPLWAELKVDFSTQYLERLIPTATKKKG